MFFSWYAKNKHFKKGHNLSGQIMPFLLVIIAIFLGAAVATVQIGGWGSGGALNMTCSDNAADACSLAASSMWALALNTLAQANVGLRNGYQSVFNMIQNLTMLSTNFLTFAQTLITVGKVLVLSAIANSGPGWPCTIWYQNLAASNSLNSAVSSVTTAKSLITAAITVNSMMDNYVTMAKLQQQAALCNLTVPMAPNGNDGKPELAGKTGVAYANSFNCNVDPAVISVPNITTYQVEVAKMVNPPCSTDPYNYKLALPALVEKLDQIVGGLQLGSTVEKGIYTGSVWAHQKCVDAWNALPNIILSELYMAEALAAYGALTAIAIGATAAGAIYALWVNNLISGPPSLQNIINYNQKLPEAFAPNGGVGAGMIVSMQDCEGVGDELVIGIKDVAFDAGCITCLVGSSNSSAAFSDSNQGNMDPRYFGVGYTPRITSANGTCPGNGGVIVGSGISRRPVAPSPPPLPSTEIVTTPSPTAPDANCPQ